MTQQNHKARTAGIYAADSKEFHLKEFECLRKEVEMKIEEQRTLERNVVVAVGISWAWLFHERANVPPWAWLMPCLFAVLGLARAYGITRFFRSTNAYFLTIENAFFRPDSPIGWEHSTVKKPWTRRSVIAFWGILIASTAFVAVYEMNSKTLVTPSIVPSDAAKPASSPQSPR